MISVTKRRANGRRKVNARVWCEERSRVFSLPPAQSGARVGSDIPCVKSLTMAKAKVKASASRRAGLVTLEEKVSQSELWMLKSQRTMISEHGDCRVMVPIDLERWSKRSS